jgi:hypothetical protein
MFFIEDADSIRQRSDVKRLKREKRRSASVFSLRHSMSRYKQMHVGTRLNARGTGRAIGLNLMRQRFQKSLLTTYLPDPSTVRSSRMSCIFVPLNSFIHDMVSFY